MDCSAEKVTPYLNSETVQHLCFVLQLQIKQLIVHVTLNKTMFNFKLNIARPSPTRIDIMKGGRCGKSRNNVELKIEHQVLGTGRLKIRLSSQIIYKSGNA